MTSPTLSQVIEVLESAYPPGTAEDWDAVGLVCGDSAAPVGRVLLAVDPTTAVAQDAVTSGADLLLTHHPLLLRAVHSVAADTPKGRVVHALVTGGCALYVAHTNADSAAGGVNEALADLLGLTDQVPLAPHAEGAGTGLGRVGALPGPITLAELAERLGERLPATAQGVRVSGDADALVTTVAVCGGSGDSLFEAARASGADVYVTADLRHHPAAEAREHRTDGRPFLVDLAHWASEWPWLDRCAALLRERFPDLEVEVSARRTDPWTFVVAREDRTADARPDDAVLPDHPARGSTP